MDFKVWFANWYGFEVVEDAKVFTKNDLKTGMFGIVGESEAFVIIGSRIIYQKGGFDDICELKDDLSFRSRRKIMKVYDSCYSFDHLESTIAGTERHLAKLVYDRERGTEKFYNGKVVCIDNSGNAGIHTVGKIYQFEEGKLLADNGIEYPAYERIHSFEEWSKWTPSKFIEIKE